MDVWIQGIFLFLDAATPIFRLPYPMGGSLEDRSFHNPGIPTAPLRPVLNHPSVVENRVRGHRLGERLSRLDCGLRRLINSREHPIIAGSAFPEETFSIAESSCH